MARKSDTEHLEDYFIGKRRREFYDDMMDSARQENDSAWRDARTKDIAGEKLQDLIWSCLVPNAALITGAAVIANNYTARTAIAVGACCIVTEYIRHRTRSATHKDIAVQSYRQMF